MDDNIFLRNQKEPRLEDYMNFEPEGRGNLGGEIPVVMYRLLLYSMRDQLCESLGAEMQVELFRKAGYKAGCFFAERLLDKTLPLNAFIASLQKMFEKYKIGVLRIESIDPENEKIVLTVAEDLGCPGLPLRDEAVCNYDEGFISGILSAYTGKPYRAFEVDCWARQGAGGAECAPDSAPGQSDGHGREKGYQGGMAEKNCEMLFQYLRSILYDQKIQKLDIEKLDEPFRELGEGLQVLQRSVEEMLEYSRALSVGNLSGYYPSKDNFLCVNLKNLHANLNHLTWQAQQVAKGDYSQQVSYLGVFQEAFNEMTKQLKEREDELKEETKKLQHQTEVISGYNDAFIEMARMRQEVIAVIDRESRQCVYCNKQVIHVSGKVAEDRPYISRYSFYDRLTGWDGSEQLSTWEMRDGSGLYYRINTFPIVWQGRKAWCHTVLDITRDKQEQDKLTDIAYHDPGTHIFNRRYFDEYMDHVSRNQCDATLCYLDLDGLKYINDHFGHEEGDRYLGAFVHIIQNSFRSEDILARIGGDEFALILYGCHKELAERKLADVLEKFRQEGSERYPCSFSYGVVEIDGRDRTMTLDEIIRQADAAMYECKREHKRSLSRQWTEGKKQDTEG